MSTSSPQPATIARLRFLLLVVDGSQATGLADELADHDVDVVVCGDPAEALLQAGSLRPDAVLAAADLQPVDSATLVRVLSQCSGIPVLLAVGGGDGQYAAAALAAGATACVARPYRPREVLPILRAIRPDTVIATDPPLQVGALRLSPSALEAYLHERPIRLPLREFLLLQMLMVNADRVVTREQIRAKLWKDSTSDVSNTVTVHIQRLRARLGDDPHNPRIIRTVRGIGYRLLPAQIPAEAGNHHGAEDAAS